MIWKVWNGKEPEIKCRLYGKGPLDDAHLMTSRPIFWAWYEDGLLTTGNPILAHTTIIDDAGTPVGTFGELVMLLYGHNYRVCPWNSTYCVEPIWGDLRIETYTTVCGLA